MVLTDPESSPSDRAGGEPTPPSAASAETPFTEPWGRLLALVIAAALIAGVASFLAGEVILKSYQGDLVPTLKVRPSPEDVRRLSDARVHSASFAFMAMGGAFGMTMGLAGGLARRSVAGSARAAIPGLLLGTTVVTSLALVLVSNFYKRYDPHSGELVLPLLTHGAIWSTVGAIGGLAFGLGLGAQGRWKTTLVGGLVGGAAATILYEIVGALAFATQKTDLPVSSSITTRGMAHVLVALLSAVGAVLALRLQAEPSRPSDSRSQ
jgi:hypothetical protein